MITKQNIFLRKFRSLILRTLYTIENDNDCNFETNGEKVFINYVAISNKMVGNFT